MRLFFAVTFPDATLDALVAIVDELRARAVDAPIAWESRRKLHITLKFLGDVADDVVPSLVQAVRPVAARHHGYDLALAGVSAFPAEDVPRILWIGVGEGNDGTKLIADDVDAATFELGFEREKRPFVPHVTVARSKGRRGERAAFRLLASPRPFEPIRAHVASIVLMASRQGAYEILHEFELAA